MQLDCVQDHYNNYQPQEEGESCSAYRRQYALWQAFMRAALGSDPQDMPNLAYIIRDIAAYNAQGEQITIQDNQGNIQENPLKKAAVIVTDINTIQTRYVPAEHTDEGADKLAFNDFQTNLESDDNDVLVEALSERGKAAATLAQQAAAMGWQTVDTSGTTNPDERYLLELACHKAGITPVQTIDKTQPQIHGDDLAREFEKAWSTFQQDSVTAYNQINFPTSMPQETQAAGDVPDHIKRMKLPS